MCEVYILEEELEFESLVPDITYEEKKEPFLKALRWAIDNKDNKNIAITGSYGAGKSSLIDTFIKQENLEEETVKISIATFNKETLIEVASDSKEEESIPLENILEQQIIQQLFYKIEPDKIPFSQFTRFFDIDKNKAFALIFYFLFMIIITYSMFNFNWLPKIYHGFMSGDLNIATLIVICGLFLGCLYTYFVYIIILIFQKLGLTKFGFGNTSIEVVSKDNNTVFNRYLDEIIYLFKQSKYKYVIFEDLDRFENIGIYERLKGLNIILNNTKQLSEQEIVFIYALKDDLFTNGDGGNEIYNRTKFFDFIIPTVKVVHTSNAENILLYKLKSEIKSENNLLGLSKDFIEDIALYVNDMRILKNICNEYKIYKEALMNNGITANGLFAFIVYKNIYPGDYSSLLSNKGKLYQLLNIKDNIINEIIKEIEDIQKIIEVGNISENYNSNEIEILFYLNNDVISGINQIDVLDAQEKTVRSILRDNSYNNKIYFHGLFSTCLKQNENFKLRVYRNSYTPTIDNGKEFFKIGDKLNYLERYKAVLYNEQKESWENKQENLEQKQNKIKINSLSYLLKAKYLESEFIDNIKLNDELLYFLIRNGWIDEAYEEYLSYFYEGSLSKNDSQFLKNIRNGIVGTEELKLKNTSRVLDRIKLEEISSPGIFNFDLFEYLIKTNHAHTEKYSKYVTLLFDEEEGKNFYIKFILGLAADSNFSPISKLISYCINEGLDIWGIVDNLTNEQKEQYIFSLINSWSQISRPSSINEEMKVFIEDVEVKEFYNSCSKRGIEKILLDLNIKFNNISSLEDEEKKYIVKHSYYKINLINIQHILEVINVKNALEDNLISEYVEENIEEYISKVILKLDSYNENEETLIKLLNDKKLNDTTKYQLTKKFTNKIGDISKLNSIINIYRFNKMVFSINNLVSLFNHTEYKENDFDLDLVFKNNINFLDLISTSQCLNDISEQDYIMLSSELLNSNSVGVQEIVQLFEQSTRYIYIQFNLESASDNTIKKIVKLIELKFIYWNEKIYRSLVDYQVDKEILVEYLLESLENKEDLGEELTLELSSLNNEGLLPWSETLFNELDFDEVQTENYFVNISKDVPEDYVLNNIKIKIPLVSSLNLKWSTRASNKKYFLSLLSTNITEENIRESIELINFWDVDIFRTLLINNYAYAIKYANKFKEDLINTELSQEEFDYFIKEGFSNELIITIYNNNKYLPNNNFLIWLIDDNRYTFLTELHNELDVLLAFNQQSNISMILNWYIDKKKYNKQEIFDLLSRLKPPYSEIKIKNGNNKVFKDDEHTRKLLEKLKVKGMITEPKFNNEGEIIINNRRK